MPHPPAGRARTWIRSLGSAAAGLMAGAAINGDLVLEDTRAAVAAARELVAVS